MLRMITNFSRTLLIGTLVSIRNICNSLLEDGDLGTMTRHWTFLTVSDRGVTDVTDDYQLF